jgi:hypothetical protein
VSLPWRTRAFKGSAAGGWAALVVTLAGACGDESDADARAAQESWCGATCAAAERCGEGTGPRCAESCLERPTGYFLRMKPDALWAQADCVARAAACPDGLDVLVNTCLAETALDLPATRTSEKMCEVMAAPLFECGWFSSFEQCASFYGSFTEPALDAWRTCDDILDCEAFGQCASLTIYSYGD